MEGGTMDAKSFLEVMHVAEKLKNHTRHSWTSSGRHESVAEHSWRLCLMAYFVRDEYPEADMDKVLKMCLVHDIGEAFTGDIPTFEKTSEDERTENDYVDGWVSSLPEPFRGELGELFEEMERLESLEARIYKALDKMEAVIQHNEADIKTWLPLEYDLQLTYGKNETGMTDFTRRLKDEVDRVTREKIQREGMR